MLYTEHFIPRVSQGSFFQEQMSSPVRRTAWSCRLPPFPTRPDCHWQKLLRDWSAWWFIFKPSWKRRAGSWEKEGAGVAKFFLVVSSEIWRNLNLNQRWFTYGVVFQQEQADHHDVDVRSYSAIFKKTGDLQQHWDSQQQKIKPWTTPSHFHVLCSFSFIVHLLLTVETWRNALSFRALQHKTVDNGNREKVQRIHPVLKMCDSD